MKEIIDKISSYNLFNYLFPGILFSFLSGQFTRFSLVQKDLVVGVFVYYFIGLVISRFGSLILEPLLKKIKFLEFADYKDFIVASKEDPKLEVLSEVNNMYRTLCSLFIMLLFFKIYEMMIFNKLVQESWTPYITVFFLFIIFLCSYRKQTSYIFKRIKK